MDRREFNHCGVSALGLLLLGAYRHAHALSLAELSERDLSAGLRSTLERGALTAVQLLGRHDGFLGNPMVRIALPRNLQDAGNLMKKIGQGKRVDELVTAMNRGAEQAVPFAKDLLVSAVKGMSLADARGILKGGDTSVTSFFAEKTRQPVAERFLPIVTQVTNSISLAQKYNALAGKAALLGLVKADDARVEHHVTTKSLDGLYTMIAEEEKKIRHDPARAGNDLAKKIFGLLK